MRITLTHLASDPAYRRRKGLRTANWPVNVGVARWSGRQLCGLTLRLGNRLHVLLWR